MCSPVCFYMCWLEVGKRAGAETERILYNLNLKAIIFVLTSYSCLLLMGKAVKISGMKIKNGSEGFKVMLALTQQ